MEHVYLPPNMTSDIYLISQCIARYTIFGMEVSQSKYPSFMKFIVAILSTAHTYWVMFSTRQSIV